MRISCETNEKPCYYCSGCLVVPRSVLVVPPKPFNPPRVVDPTIRCQRCYTVLVLEFKLKNPAVGIGGIVGLLLGGLEALRELSFSGVLEYQFARQFFDESVYVTSNKSE